MKLLIRTSKILYMIKINVKTELISKNIKNTFLNISHKISNLPKLSLHFIKNLCYIAFFMENIIFPFILDIYSLIHSFS